MGWFQRFAQAVLAAAALTIWFLPVRAQDLDTLYSEADPARLEAFADAVQEGLPYMPGELLVHFKDGVDSVKQASALHVLRFDSNRTRTSWIADTMLLTGLPETDAEHAAALMLLQPEVEYAHPNYLQRLHAVPNDPFYARQWNLDQIRMPKAWV